MCKAVEKWDYREREEGDNNPSIVVVKYIDFSKHIDTEESETLPIFIGQRIDTRCSLSPTHTRLPSLTRFNSSG